MRALLDVNVLIALLDRAHPHHQRARDWMLANAASGWASCPLTENGCIRVMSLPPYNGHQPPSVIAAKLEKAAANSDHEFWPADISLLDTSLVDRTRIHGPLQLTDAYLLALAVRHGGLLATFDATIPISAVLGYHPSHMVVL